MGVGSMWYTKKYKNFIIRKIFDLVMLFYKPERTKLGKVLSYCSENIDFYRGMGSRLENYPFIDKKVLMYNIDRFINKKFRFKNVGLTSGTTGTPGKFFRDIKSMAAEQYFQNRYFNWKSCYRVIFRGERLFDNQYSGDRIYRTVPLIREMYVSSFHINDQTLKNLVEKLATIRKKCLWAYPSSAYALAEYCKKNNIRLKFDVVALSSEILMDYRKDLMEEVFQCRVMDWYGQAERVAALVRCEHGHYHELEHYSYVEYLPAEDNMFEVAGTTLHNKIMPIIRYNMHDLVEISEEPCLCGAKGKNVTRIHGRTTCYIELPNGRLAETPLAFLFKGMENVVEAQVVQKVDKQIIIKVVRDRDYSDENEKMLIEHVSGFIPAELYKLEYVDRIERDARGKFRYVINEGMN